MERSELSETKNIDQGLRNTNENKNGYVNEATEKTIKVFLQLVRNEE